MRSHRQIKQHIGHYINGRRRLVFCLLMVERLWPLVQPLVLAACALAICAWFGLFPFLPFWLHGLILAGFAVVAVVALVRLRHFHLPRMGELDRHLEQKSALAFQPLRAQFDELVQKDRVAEALWHAHQSRMRASLQNLKIGIPAPQMPKRDPYGLRSLVFLSFAIAFAYSFSPHAGRIGEAFHFSRSPVSALPLRIDAWINPPEYTGMAPLYLNANVGEGRENRLVPHGSVVHFRLVNAPSGVRLSRITDAGQREDLRAQEAEQQETVRHYQWPLTEDVQLQLTTPQGEKDWFLTVIADAPPKIDWAGEPKRALNATLELPYEMEDDYGVIKAWAEISPLGLLPETDLAPLYDAPQIALVLPRTLKGRVSTRHDFTNHPWAGVEVEIVLHAQDGAGNRATSQPLSLVLPQRVFGNPLARAVVEQRRLLVQSRTHRDLVADMLAALLVRPDDTIRNATHTLALQSAWTRLSYARDDEGLRGMADYLWQIALGIEEGGVKTAEERLRQAQQALRDALRNGASSQEIERLMQELRQAMQDYIAALAERSLRSSPSQEAGDRQRLQQGDLEQRLQQLQEMAQLGNRAAAEQLLNELENLLNNLQVLQGENGEGEPNRNERSTMQQNMDELADMLRRQQDLMNETDRLTQEWRRGERSGEEYAEMMEGLSETQEQLRQEWENLAQTFPQQGQEGGEAMEEAGEAMGQARDELGQGEGEGATGSQGRALEAMRRAGQNMMQALREGGQGERGEQSGRSVDPLGRERQNSQMSQESDIKVPTEIDMERARRILDEIRSRLQYGTPSLERHYLERLLNFD